MAYWKTADEKDAKDSKYTKLASIISAIFALIAGLNNNIPCSEFYLIKNESSDYTNQMEIEISCEKFPLFKVYYTLDKTNPENGIKYEETILYQKIHPYMQRPNSYIGGVNCLRIRLGLKR